MSGDRPIEVDAWQWRQMILSEHGPAELSHRIVALVIEAHMSSRHNAAWPSQETIARRAQLSARHARRVLDALDVAGWVTRHQCHRPGQQRPGRSWRVTVYGACVPAALRDLIPAGKGADIQASSPPANGQDIQMSSARQNGADIQASSARNEDRTFQTEDRTSGARGEDMPRREVRTFGDGVRTSECPTNSSSEASIGSLHVNVPVEPMRAATPSPAEAGSAAQIHQKAERRDTERTAAIGRLLRAGKAPEEIAVELGEPLEYVLYRKQLRDLNPFGKARQR